MSTLIRQFCLLYPVYPVNSNQNKPPVVLQASGRTLGKNTGRNPEDGWFYKEPRQNRFENVLISINITGLCKYVLGAKVVLLLLPFFSRVLLIERNVVKCFRACTKLR